MKSFEVGVDIGNYDIKTPHTVTPSGYSVKECVPFGVDEYIKLGDKYYIPSEERFPYVKDKTQNERAFVFTLFGIAKEMFRTFDKSSIKGKDKIQKEINDYGTVNLGVGLPPAHMHMLKEKTVAYYKEMFEKYPTFEYKGFSFNLKLGLIGVVPQDFAALTCVIGNGEKNIPNTFKEYYAADIGGATVDIVPIRNNAPLVEKCVSLELGVLLMYDKIQNYVEENYGISLSNTYIEDVLRNEPTIIDDDIVEAIKNIAAQWLENIIEVFSQRGISFQAMPIVFIGGGAKLFREEILNNKVIKKSEFIGNANSNALGYQKFIKKLVYKSKNKAS